MRSTLSVGTFDGPPTINLATSDDSRLASLKIVDGEPGSISLEVNGGHAHVQNDGRHRNAFRCEVQPGSDSGTATLYVPPGVRVGFAHISAIAERIEMDAMASLHWGSADWGSGAHIALNVTKAIGVHAELTGYTVDEFEVSDLYWGQDPAIPQHHGWSWSSTVSIERRVDPGDGDFKRAATIRDPLSLGIGPWEVVMAGVAPRGAAAWKAAFGISRSGHWYADTQHTTANVAWGRRSVTRAESVGLH